MNSEEKLLWNQIVNFQFDKPETKLKFAQRLARENGWTKAYTERVILEYKKFLFLSCVSPIGVTPSDPVDQAWHLHLTYTKSYWQDMCDGILKKRVHHNPTEGGKTEAVKFDDWYTKTRDLYISKFNSIPPTDIWQENEERFSDIDFERVNKKKNWVIPKPNWKRVSELLGILTLAMGSIYATDWAAIIVIFLVILVVILILWAIFGGRNNRRGGGGSSSSSGCSSSSGGWFIFSSCGSSCSSHSSGSGCGSSGCGSSCGGGGCGGGGCSS